MDDEGRMQGTGRGDGRNGCGGGADDSGDKGDGAVLAAFDVWAADDGGMGGAEAAGMGPSVFNLSVSAPPPARLEGPGPL